MTNDETLSYIGWDVTDYYPGHFLNVDDTASCERNSAQYYKK